MPDIAARPVGFIMVCIKYTISLNLSAWLLQSTFNMFIHRNADTAAAGCLADAQL